MSSYCERADIELLYDNQLIEDYATDSVQTEANIITRCILFASATIDILISDRYAVPITGDIPDIIESATATIAMYYLARRRHPAEEAFKADVDIIIDWLKNASEIPGLKQDSDKVAWVSTSKEDRYITIKSELDDTDGIIDDFFLSFSTDGVVSNNEDND